MDGFCLPHWGDSNGYPDKHKLLSPGWTATALERFWRINHFIAGRVVNTGLHSGINFQMDRRNTNYEMHIYIPEGFRAAYIDQHTHYI